MSENEKLKLELKAFYIAGGSRTDALERWKLTTGQLAGLSTRLGMCWRWPLENRRSGKKPFAGIPKVPSAQRTVPRRQGEGGGGIIHSIQARQDRKAAPDTVVPADAPLYVAGSAPRRYGKPLSVLTRQRAERGYSDSDTEFGGPLSPFPTPREVSNNPDDLSRAEIHAIAARYRR